MNHQTVPTKKTNLQENVTSSEGATYVSEKFQVQIKQNRMILRTIYQCIFVIEKSVSNITWGRSKAEAPQQTVYV